MHVPKGGEIVFQTKSGSLRLRADVNAETFWLTQQQVAAVFDVQKAAISKHVRSIFESGELSKEATVSTLETVQTEGGRSVTRRVEHYNLDLVISIGYRVNSKKATSFRQWATKVLRGYISDGFAIDRKLAGRRYEQFMDAVEAVKKMLPAASSVDRSSVLELVGLFADTWFSLDAFDKDLLTGVGMTKAKVELTAELLTSAIGELRGELMGRGEATELFGQARNASAVKGIVGNVMQSFGGKELYPSVEGKAAHLLYFLVKNHPFSDGNKRSGAFAFVWFLNKAGRLDRTRITPPALTALTLLVAESDPKDKDRMVRLVMELVRDAR